MRKEVTVTGKTVEAALEEAVQKLGAPSVSDITYTVLEEARKGLFGIGSSMAKIHAVYELGGEMIALEFIKQVADDMGLHVTVTMKDGNNRDKLIVVDGDTAGVLIGHHGETMDALQYLANLAANRRPEDEDGVETDRKYVRITLDVEGYRAKREEALRALARRMADKVVRYKKSIMLEPMNPYERRIIHSEIQNVEGVATNSIGVENNRRVVIYLEGGDPNGADARDARESGARRERSGGRRRSRRAPKPVEEDIPIFPIEDLY